MPSMDEKRLKSLIELRTYQWFLRPVPFSIRLIHILSPPQVYCSARDAGCVWVGELGDLASHVAAGKESGPCQFVLVRCQLGCSQDVRRGDLSQHVENECPCRLQSCPYCGEEATGKK